MVYPGEEGIPLLGPIVWSIRERRVSLSWDPWYGLSGRGGYPCPRTHGMVYPGEEGIPVLGPMVWSIRERRVSLSWDPWYGLSGRGGYPCPRTHGMAYPGRRAYLSECPRTDWGSPLSRWPGVCTFKWKTWKCQETSTPQEFTCKRDIQHLKQSDKYLNYTGFRLQRVT